MKPRPVPPVIRIGAHRFDGSGKVLAHTYYPPPNGSTAAGDSHYDSGEDWVLTGSGNLSSGGGGGGGGGGKGGDNLMLWEPEAPPVRLFLDPAGAGTPRATPAAPVRTAAPAASVLRVDEVRVVAAGPAVAPPAGVTPAAPAHEADPFADGIEVG